MVKKLFKCLVFVSFTGCVSTVQKNENIIKPVKTVDTSVAVKPIEVPNVLPEAAVPLAVASLKTVPKIGLIFSGGGAKSWAHIGVLKEIEKFKWPVHSVAGFEWGAVVAAAYAQNLSSNEVEWEMLKVTELNKVKEISDMIFEKKSVSDLKIPFVCPSLNIQQQNIYLLNRGVLDKLIPFCLAHPPLSEAYSQSIAEVSDVSALAMHLRATGATKIVLINVLSQKSKSLFFKEASLVENILWARSAALMAKKINGVDEVVSIDLSGYGMNDIEKKREIIAKGSELSYNTIKQLTHKLGF